LITENIGQHLTIGSSWERAEFVYSNLDFSRLRSLTVFGKWEPFFISNKMRVLRVLDLGVFGCPFKTFGPITSNV